MTEGPRLKPMEEAGRRLAEVINQHVPGETAFALHLFSIGEGGWSTFISNVQREDHAAAMLEFIIKAHPQTLVDFLKEFEDDGSSPADFIEGRWEV